MLTFVSEYFVRALMQTENAYAANSVNSLWLQSDATSNSNNNRPLGIKFE